MCGIAGIINYHEPHRITDALLTRMLTRIKHRGPDESGFYIGQKVGIGNVRLSIIDIATGQQPLSNYDGNLWIVFNGEIFNYIELRQDLEDKGHKFKTQSDTEVIVHLYEEYGPDCVSKLNGQFAFAIWNKKTEELFLARDRVGIRPLFYSQINGSFVFGSEIKALFEYEELIPELDEKSLAQVFTFWTTITPHTSFKNVFEVPPGHHVLISKKGINIEKYWSLKFPDAGHEFKGSFDEAKEQFRSLFYDSVRIRLRADVEVAAYLSGGIDSSVTTAFIKEIEPDVLNTFSIGFSDKDFDETLFQHEAAKYYNTRHKSFTCSTSDIAKIFPEVVWHSEIPMIRTAPAPMHALSKLVRDNDIKVVITGEGADEMLAGYNIFKETIIRQFWSKDPKSRLRPLLLKKLYPYIPQLKNANSQMLKFFFGYKLEETSSPYYSHLLRWNNTSHVQKHFSKEVKGKINGYDPKSELTNIMLEGFDNWSHLSKAQWLETSIFMSGYLLSSQGDRMGMANSIEGRYPFLDHRLLEFAASLPPDFKLKGLNEKYLLKSMMKDKLPESIRKRSKQAYRAPIAQSFLDDNAPDYVKELLDKENIRKTGVFNPETVEKFVSKLKKSERPTEIENMTLVGIISTLLLSKQFITNKKPLEKEELLKPRIIRE